MRSVLKSARMWCAASSLSISDVPLEAMVHPGSPSSETRRTACGASTSFDANPSCSRATGSWPSWISLHAGSSASAWLRLRSTAWSRMFNHAISGQPLPKHLSTDNDPLFRFHRWRANLRVLEIKEIKSVPFVPCSHPFVERLIGTVRREYLDHVLFWNRVDLQRKLARFARYYNHVRVHSALSGTTPADRGG